VKDFGALALEPRAFACGHDGDGEVVGVHTRDMVSRRLGGWALHEGRSVGTGIAGSRLRDGPLMR
jgi:hypothetical protein